MIAIAVWNVRGLNSIAHRHAVAQLVRDRGIQFVGLLETRVRRSNVQAVRAGLLPNWPGLMTMPVRGVESGLPGTSWR
ncbi:UNVERIFIED_CONTAM: hypothetical protein Sradi_5273100 [Sesamum radiatum]|uniref:Endonuclease/exonuclease/phosphatase n=1 Tax=Sesamum radiatum TaxID=300843 RepID=A0AAW2LM19_SESRA